MHSSDGFLDPALADREGVVAVGGALDGPRLLAAYRRGVFPWNGDPVRWYCPDPRAIFWQVQLPRRLARMLRRGSFRITYDRAFGEVISACAAHHHAAGVWITSAFERAYGELHEMGHAHSVEVWREDTLVGGLYGVQVGGVFSGESMFHRVPDASKVAFAALVYHLDAIGVVLFDSQIINAHTYALGAVLVRRGDFLRLLHHALQVSIPGDGQRWPVRGAAQVAASCLGPTLEHGAVVLAGAGVELPDADGGAGIAVADGGDELAERVRFWSIRAVSGPDARRSPPRPR